MIERMWIKSGIVEDFDERQEALLAHILVKIKEYYRDLHQTRNCYKHPLTLKRLMLLSHRSSYQVLSAVRVLANSTVKGSPDEPPIFYDRIQSQKNASHRPYRIFLRKRR